MTESLEWQCEECGHTFYRRNPRGCPKCGQTVLFPVEVEESKSNNGRLQTEEFDTTDAIDRLQEMKPERDHIEKDHGDSDYENLSSEPEQKEEATTGLLDRLRVVLGVK